MCLRKAPEKYIAGAALDRAFVKACRRVVTSTLLYVIGSESSCDLGSVTYKLNLKNYNYSYSIYILNLVGRSVASSFAISLFLVVSEGLKLVHLGAS
jgi:hypothetical protein